MMQTLRKKTRLVLFIALAFFAGLIFFQWGLDITGIRGRPERDIAKIGDRTITYQEYRSFAMARENENRNITSDEIWNMLIEEFTWRDLAEKERIGVNDDEIWAIIKSNPPPQIYNSEFMQNEQGEFDWNKYGELIKSPQSLQWLYEYEMQLRRNLPKEKLRSLVSTMAWVSPFEDSLALYEQTVAFDISFLSLQVIHLRGSITITDEEVADYYKKHRDEFATPEYKVLKYVFFDRKPSPGDTLEARERLEDMIALVSEGEDFLQLAREVSDDTTIEYSFENENILRPYMRDVYKELRNGEVSGVVPAARGFEVMKRVRDGLMYVVKANVQVSRTTIGEITDNIAAFVETAEDIGFDSAAVDLDIAVRRTYPLGLERSTFPVRNVEGLSDFVEKVKPGDISNPFSSLGGYYVFALDSVVPAQKPSLEEAFPRVKAAIENEDYRKLLAQRLDDIYAQLMSGKSMAEIAVSDTVVKFQGGLKDQKVHVLRNMHGDEFAGALISLEPGQISKPVIARYSGYIIRCDRKEETPVDSTMAGMLQWSRQMRIQHISQVLFTPEKLVDNRDVFFE